MINFDSFYRVANHFQEEDDEALQKELKEAFRLYDKEGNGYIPTSSLREILAALDDQITPDQMDGMIAEIDTDGSGTVDFDGKIFFYFIFSFFISFSVFIFYFHLDMGIILFLLPQFSPAFMKKKLSSTYYL